jgi:erythromycin esterase
MSIVRDIDHSADLLKKVQDLRPLVNYLKKTQIVLLGESTHGTREFYTWRAEISKQLILKHGFTAIGIEADWPDGYLLNKFVKDIDDNPPTGESAVQQFDRWPTWMWSNSEMADFLEWLRDYNRMLKQEEKVGIYGLDMYSLWRSLACVSAYVEKFGSEASQSAHQAFKCFEGYHEDPQEYAQAALIPSDCQDEVVKLLKDLEVNFNEYNAKGQEDYFNALQNARVVKNAENYYRSLMLGGANSWNIRTNHMFETLSHLVASDERIIVWAHNTHIGDARGTDMGEYGMISLGQLVRDKWNKQSALIGFATYQGTTIASTQWEEEGYVLEVPPALNDSWENLFHQAGASDRYVIFDSDNTKKFMQLRPQRAVGVVYNPLAEAGNYVPTRLSQRYDALIYLDKTRALTPLPTPIQLHYFRT